MPPSRADLELAMLAYWRKLDQQGTAAQLIGSTAEGKARFVRGGGHFNSLINLLARFFVDAGYPIESIGAGQSNPACEPASRLDWQHLCAALQARLTYLAALGYP